VLAVVALIPGAFTALLVVQDGGAELSYYFASNNANQIHAQLAQLPGGLAWDYLRGDLYPALKVEWTAFDRHILDSRNVPFSSFESLIFTHCDKSSISYTFVGTINASFQRQVYSEADLNSISSSVFINKTSDGVAIVHVVFLSGSFSDPSAVGISYAGDRFAIFGDSLSDPFLRVAIAHEMGHLLGLVAPLGLDSPYTPANASVHYDFANPPHCTSNPCLMRPTVSSYDKTCQFCTADLLEIKNHTAPYTFSGQQPSARVGQIAVGAGVTALLLASALILYRQKNGL
jgi:hypothetical protein